MTPVFSAADVTAKLRPVLQRLPMQPPTFALKLALNHWLLPRLPKDSRAALSNRTVQVDVTDLGLTLKLQLQARGFVLAPSGSKVELRIAAESQTFWRLMRGTDDADRLFFERALVMEGDTELGLILKNTIDAIGPLW